MKIITTMKYSKHTLAILSAMLLIGCNKEKAAIDESTDATKEVIESRKAEVNANANYANQKTDANAKMEKARIEANKVSLQAQLDADKKKAEAEGDAAKAKVDFKNR